MRLGITGVSVAHRPRDEDSFAAWHGAPCRFVLADHGRRVGRDLALQSGQLLAQLVKVLVSGQAVEAGKVVGKGRGQSGKPDSWQQQRVRWWNSAHGRQVGWAKRIARGQRALGVQSGQEVVVKHRA